MGKTNSKQQSLRQNNAIGKSVINLDDYRHKNSGQNNPDYATLSRDVVQANQRSLPTLSRQPRNKSYNSQLKSKPMTAIKPAKNNFKVKNTSRNTNRINRSTQKKTLPWVKYIIRLIILGVGFGAIAGTILSFVEQNNQALAGAGKVEQTETEVQKNPLESHVTNKLVLGQELLNLKPKIQELATKMPQMQPGLFFVDVDNGDYLDIESATIFSAASTIKIPVLVAFFQDVDAGKISLDEKLTIEQDVIGGGSGSMRYEKPGTQHTALETATKMIIISDNTATNMLIKHLGGKDVLNQRFRDWGLTNTVINNALPDLQGTNTTSPRDLGNLLAIVNQGELVSLKSRDRLLGIMRETHTRTLLPQGLGAGAIIAHKTGDIGTILADAGIVDLPNGKRYIAVAMVKRPHNDYTARTLIQNISRTVYQYFNQSNFILTPESENNRNNQNPDLLTTR